MYQPSAGTERSTVQNSNMLTHENKIIFFFSVFSSRDLRSLLGIILLLTAWTAKELIPGLGLFPYLLIDFFVSLLNAKAVSQFIQRKNLQLIHS